MGIQSDIRNVFKPQSPSDRKTKEYLISASLGRGSFGQVYEARWKPASGGTKQVALKIIQKQTVSEEYFDFKEEVDILKSLNHANIVHLWDHFATPDHYFLALELATGGDVYQYIKRRGKFTESNAQSIIRQVLSGVAYLHANNIIHRDIKPENILFLNQSPDSPIVIADFGTAKRLEDESEEMAEVCGSFYYLSPEVMAGKTYGIKVDIWAIGTMCFIFLCGYPPYRGDTVNDRDFAMNKGSLKFHTDFWKKVSPLAQEFCKYLLTVDPLYRPTAQEALDHPWIGGNVQSEHDLSRTIMDNIDSKSIWRKTLNMSGRHCINKVDGFTNLLKRHFPFEEDQRTISYGTTR